MFISTISTDLCTIRQNIKTKSAFADIVCSALVVKIIGRAHKNLFNNHWYTKRKIRKWIG